ncbi:MAG: hypothetical protein K8J31_08360 [Anaerolineae bacterium]|nr:hypothetical protein [Anaerolineae bacterium]
MNRPAAARDWPRWILLGLMASALSLPWLDNPGASQTLNVMDLAEWSSLHPVVRATVPPLLAPCLLRSLWVGVGALIAFMPSSRHGWWLRAALVGLIAVALLPPFEFFVSDREDMNYRQQLMLSIALVLIGGIGLSRRFESAHRRIQLAVVGIGAAFSLIGLWMSQGFMLEFGLPTNMGFGGVLFLVICSIFALAENRRGNFS